jgi:DNA mismatch repair endonuclease MutH
MLKPYNENSKQSILEYAQQLEGKTLREVLSNNIIANMPTDELGNKGRYGQKIERYYFGYATNSNASADFPCGLELKATPLRVLKSGKLAPKERLVCNIINYLNIVNEKWETSSFLEKNLDTLIIRYIDPIDKNISQLDYKIFNVNIHNIFSKNDDGEQFKKDWNFIVDKIKKGEAHLLSESDTTYLGACTKGSTAAKSLRQQPYSDTFAKQRAFSFKTQFMRELLNRI